MIELDDKKKVDDENCERSDEGSYQDSQDDYIEREKWGSQFEFILAIAGYSVAFGNLMRFPYLCMRNGGGMLLLFCLLSMYM